MNDRIRVLAKQAGLIEYSTDSKLQNAEKFAELIVRECAAILIMMDDAVNGNHNYYRHAAVQIKEHFGVE